MRTLISGLLCTLLGAAIWFYSGTFPELPEGYPGPGLFPRIIAAGLLLSGLALLAQGARLRRQREDAVLRPVPAGLLRLAGGLLVVVLYPWLKDVSGTMAALALICLAVAWMLGVSLRVAVPTAIGSGVLIYLVFSELLRVPL